MSHTEIVPDKSANHIVFPKIFTKCGYAVLVLLLQAVHSPLHLRLPFRPLTVCPRCALEIRLGEEA